MDVKEYRYVLEIAKCGSFSDAAKSLYISQPSLSMYIKNLEDRLGLVLFDRSRGALHLTYAGDRYVEYAQQILRLNSQLEKEIESIKGIRQGEVNIGIPAVRGSYLLPLILPSFCQAYPDIEIKLTEDTSSALEKKLENKEIDFAILNHPFRNDNLEYETLYEEEIVLLLHKSNPVCAYAQRQESAKYPWIDLSLLKNQGFILLKRGQRIRQITDALFLQADFEPKVLLETSSAIAASRMTDAGMGATFISDAYLQLHDTENVSAFSIGLDRVIWYTVIAYPSKSRLSIAAESFIKLIVSLLKAPPIAK